MKVMPETHGAYKALRLAKEGQLPDRRTRLGSAVAAIESRIIEHFGELNSLQQVQLFNMLPLVLFLLKHPMTTDNGNLAADFKWAWQRVENGLKVLCDLADKKKAKKVPTIADIVAECQEPAPEPEKPRSIAEIAAECEDDASEDDDIINLFE